jgi:hypothetical protein
MDILNKFTLPLSGVSSMQSNLSRIIRLDADVSFELPRRNPGLGRLINFLQRAVPCLWNEEDEHEEYKNRRSPNESLLCALQSVNSRVKYAIEFSRIEKVGCSERYKPVSKKCDSDRDTLRISSKTLSRNLNRRKVKTRRRTHYKTKETKIDFSNEPDGESCYRY